MSIGEVEPWFQRLEFEPDEEKVATPILHDVLHRLKFLNKVGVGYLTLEPGCG